MPGSIQTFAGPSLGTRLGMRTRITPARASQRSQRNSRACRRYSEQRPARPGRWGGFPPGSGRCRLERGGPGRLGVARGDAQRGLAGMLSALADGRQQQEPWVSAPVLLRAILPHRNDGDRRLAQRRERGAAPRRLFGRCPAQRVQQPMCRKSRIWLACQRWQAVLSARVWRLKSLIRFSALPRVPSRGWWESVRVA